MRVKPKSSGWRQSGRIALACAVALSASSFAMAKPFASAGSFDTCVSKEVEHALQTLDEAKSVGKASNDRVRVIVNFATARGHAPSPSAVEVADARSAVLAALPAGSYETVASFSHIPAATLEIDRNALQALKSHPLVFAVNEDMEVFQQMPQSNILTGATTLHGTGVTGEGVNVWYRFTPAESGTVTIDTFGSSGSMTDTILSLVSGGYGAFSQVACNDDFPGSGLLSRVVDVPLSAGTTYTVNISRWSATATSTPGTLQLNFTYEAAPPTGAPGINVSLTDLSASASFDDDPVTEAFDIANDGDIDLDWNITEALGARAGSDADGYAERRRPQTSFSGNKARTSIPLFRSASVKATEVIQDGGFEAGIDNPFWDQNSAQFGDVICDFTCGESFQRSGSFWAWLGGSATGDVGHVQQDVTIPVGTAVLSFYLRIPSVTAGLGHMNVRIDGDLQRQFTAADQPGFSSYAQVVLDVGAYADGGTHTVRFEYETTGYGSYFLDDVSLASEEEVIACTSPEDVPWLSVDPLDGTIAPEAFETVAVEFHPGVAGVGTHEAFLCIHSNDPSNPLIELPVSFTVGQAEQTIDFAELDDRGIDETPFTVSATASSGLEVSFASLTESVCEVDGDEVSLLSEGECTIEATQDGDSNYLPADPVSRSFTVSRLAQTIDFAELADRGIDETPFTLSATASSGLDVAFASLTAAVCEVDGDEVTLLAEGECSIEASQDGDANYLAADPVVRSFMVSKLEQTIDFEAIGDKVFGDMPFLVVATASSGLEVSIASLTPEVCAVDGFEVSLVDVGECSLEATQDGDDTYAAAAPVQQSFDVIEPPVEIFADGFESEPAPQKIQLEGEGVKLLSVPAVDRLARSIDGKIAVLAELRIGSERVGLIEARCGAGSCELRVVSFDAEKQFVAGGWWRIESEPALFRIRSSDSAVIGIERFNR